MSSNHVRWRQVPCLCSAPHSSHCHTQNAGLMSVTIATMWCDSWGCLPQCDSYRCGLDVCHSHFTIPCILLSTGPARPLLNIVKVKVKWSRYRPRVAQRVGRGIAPLFLNRGTRRGWVVSSTPRPHFTPGKDPIPILQEAGWAPRPVWTGGKSRPHRDSIPDRPARSQLLYRLSYPAH